MDRQVKRFDITVGDSLLTVEAINDNPIKTPFSLSCPGTIASNVQLKIDS